jgi:hypothetical protein
MEDQLVAASTGVAMLAYEKRAPFLFAFLFSIYNRVSDLSNTQGDSEMQPVPSPSCNPDTPCKHPSAYDSKVAPTGTPQATD